MTDVTVTLKPCPFCGGEAGYEEGHRNHWRVVCMNCGLAHPTWVAREIDPKPALLAAWNQRADAQEEAVALRRIVYNLQLGGDRLCDALRKIAAGSENPEAVAKAALDHKAAWLEPPAQDVAALVSALEPFAKAAEIKLFPIGYWTDDKRIHGTDIGFHITFGDLRRAAEALANYGAKP